jgi:SEC-C motif-containing protein
MPFMTDICPCGSGKDYPACCGLLHSGQATAKTAEQLMRSRYSAYALKQIDYLYATTHPEHRSADLKKQMAAWAERAEFVRLEVLAVRKGRSGDKIGKVEFVAHYRQYGEIKQMHEESRFRRHQGNWHYVDGDFKD